MVIVGAVYMLVAFVSTRAVPPHVLGASKAPLLTVVEHTAPWSLKFFGGIAMFAVANTSLLNCVMGSRLIYGMSREGLLPAWLGRVHPTRHTPYVATMLVIAIALVLAVTGTVAHLGGTTSLLLLIVFIVVNIALLAIRRGETGYTGFRVPSIVPIASIGTCAVLILFSQQASMAIAAGLGVVGVAIAISRRNSKTTIQT
jgi:amino acid transporter